MDDEMYEIFKHIETSPFSDGYQVELGFRPAFHRRLSKWVDNLDIDHHEYKYTNRGLVQTFKNILIEIAKEEENITKSEFDNIFQRRKGEVLSRLVSEEPTEYTAVFPLMLRSEALPNTIELYSSDAEVIDHQTWTDDYLSIAMSDEDTNFKSFFQELPNDFSNTFEAQREWTYLKSRVPAQDELYALVRIANLVELRLAELNFYNHLWVGDMPTPSTSNQAPTERWSRLSEPPFYLLYKDQKFVRYQGVDYDYHRPEAYLNFPFTDVDSLNEIPSFNYLSDRDTLEGHIVNALLAYQDGITERSVRQSYFSFWRGIELLSQTDDSKEMVDRAEFALKYHLEEDTTMRPSLREAIPKLPKIRNSLVHDGLKTQVHRNHVNAAKLLLDGLLYTYINNISDWELDDIQTFLEYGAQYGEKNKLYPIHVQQFPFQLVPQVVL